MMTDLKQILSIINQSLNSKESITFKNLDDGLEKLEYCRKIRDYIDLVNSELNHKLLLVMKEQGLSRYNFQGKVAVRASTSRYKCDALVKQLDKQTYQKLQQYQALRLNKKIIDKAIVDRVLEAESIEEYLKSGLIERTSRHFVRFSYPQSR